MRLKLRPPLEETVRYTIDAPLFDRLFSVEESKLWNSIPPVKRECPAFNPTLFGICYCMDE